MKKLWVTATVIVLACSSSFGGVVMYHDFGATDASEESTGFITTHQIGNGGVAEDTEVKSLIDYATGLLSGATFAVSGSNGMYGSNDGSTAGPGIGTDAYPFFNVTGLNLSNGYFVEGNNGSGPTTFTIGGLNPGATYDIAFWGARILTTDGFDQFTLSGVDGTPTNLSSQSDFSVRIDAFTTNLETVSTTIVTRGNVLRWADINPGADGIITVTMNPRWNSSNSNRAFLSAMRLEATYPAGTMISIQ